MNLSEKFRLPILAVNAILVVLTLGKITIDPTIGRSPEYRLPLQIALPGWKPLESQTIDSQYQYPDSLASNSYQFIQDNLLLTIEMHYLSNTDGEVASYIQNYTGITMESDRLSLFIRERENIGFYTLFVRENKAYLSACINPRGKTTVTSAQFNHNRYTYDLKIQRFIRWLVSRVDIWEDHCLWSHLSINIDPNSLEKTYSLLEQAWIDLYHQQDMDGSTT
ncbi:cyanoexosortase A system-associated protein [Roseofilum casamattae]|uniref:Cyanoexosortase A system-associated protein n=1 Tax=Roseofilum casamattae BLCC-M143 TaxID=3022442 RepID=A0ABT7BTT3_9CYAN|nr:cyanoexosortase A system-associated protein [Roseofilum casamattae]MDJ1182589.1 cyanoexosortase A system-associated protein [Roseofilum casamattae BLCC-M143]